jgi:CDP-glucose 4,6-dehydratase
LVTRAVSEANWRDRRVFVTGATGLLGAWVVAELRARGAVVVTLIRDDVPDANLWSIVDPKSIVGVRGSLEEFETVLRALNEHEIETVIHLGAQTIVTTASRSPLSTFEANIRGTYHILEACRLVGSVRAVIVASSDKAYGAQDTLPYTEASPLLGRNPYDASKAAADILAMSYAYTYGTPVCVTRSANLYGPGDRQWTRIVPGTIRSLLRSEPPVIRSDGRFVRDYLFVRDAAVAHLLLAERIYGDGLIGEAFNLSSENALTVLEVVNRIIALMGSSQTPVIKNENLTEIKRQTLSAAKARSVLGWTPTYTLDQGLAESIAWYRDDLREA